MGFLGEKRMSSIPICLASDNCVPAHPLIVQSVVEANQGSAPSYGADQWTQKAEQVIQKVFKTDCKVCIVPSGTGSNVLALKIACQRHESIICTDIAHIHYQESGAVESIVGCKLLTIPHSNGKVTPEGIEKKLKRERSCGKHGTCPRVLSITQPTEVGTVYSVEELKEIANVCKENDLLLHMDGSRLYHAAVRLHVGLDEIVTASHLDLLSLGGTKNGLMSAESLLIFNPNLYAGSDHLQKQTLQLVSKQRYLSAQYHPFFQGGLWRSLAKQANQKAQEIAALIEETPSLALSYPVETNQIFFTAPAPWIPLIQGHIFCYVWNEEKNQIRWITSWNTSEEDVKNVKRALAEVSQYA